MTNPIVEPPPRQDEEPDQDNQGERPEPQEDEDA